jgi:hypothetical protein
MRPNRAAAEQSSAARRRAGHDQRPALIKRIVTVLTCGQIFTCCAPI